MSEAFFKKNLKLGLELDGQLLEYPDLYDAIPNKAYVVVTVEGDDKFNAESLSLIRNPRRKTIVEAHRTLTKSGPRWTIRPLQYRRAVAAHERISTE